MNATVRVLDGVRFESESRGHKVISDQPVENGGQDGGMTPPELLLASLGTCAAYYVVQYLKVQKLPSEGLVIRVNAEKAQQPARLGSFGIEVESPFAHDEKHREGMIRAAKKCLIHNTLMVAPEIGITVRTPEPVTAE